MTEDTDKPIVSLTVSDGDAEAMKNALIAEGIEVSELSEQPVSGIFFLLPFLAGALLSGGAYDVEKFVLKRGASGVKQLVKNLQKSGRPDEKGTVLLEDEKKTTVVLPSDLPDAAYEALENLDLGKLASLTISWHDPPGEWRVDMPQRIKSGGDSF